MTADEAGAAPAPPPAAGALLLSKRPDRLRALRAAIVEKPGGGQLLGRFEFDVQALDATGASKMLRSGIGDGRWHTLLLIDGDMAGVLAPRDIGRLRDASFDRDRLLVVGVVDRPEEQAALLNLGIARVFRAEDDPANIKNQIGAAVSDAKKAVEASRAEMAKASAPVVIVQAQPSGEGLLPDRGVITVHATKGGAGKTSISSNIAYALSLSKARTILIDVNPEGGIAHAHFWKYLSEHFEDFEEMFGQEFGLTALARKMDFDSPTMVVDAEYLKRAIVPVIDDRRTGQVLHLLPGVRDQTDYQAFTTRTNRKVSNLLGNQYWLKQLIELLTRSYTYVVLDTGINRYTTMGMHALEASDLLFLVVDTENEIDMTVDEDAMRFLTGQIDEGKLRPLRKRVVIANKFDPEFTKLSEIAKRFDFLAGEEGKGVEVLPVRWDRSTFRMAQRKGVPALALEEKGRLPAAEHPGLTDLKSIVNRIKLVYGETSSEPKKRKLFGRG